MRTEAGAFRPTILYSRVFLIWNIAISFFSSSALDSKPVRLLFWHNLLYLHIPKQMTMNLDERESARPELCFRTANLIVEASGAN
jgi:hypothetical protein